MGKRTGGICYRYTSAQTASNDELEGVWNVVDGENEKVQKERKGWDGVRDWVGELFVKGASSHRRPKEAQSNPESRVSSLSLSTSSTAQIDVAKKIN